MASKKGNRIVIKLKSTASGHSYTTMKNRRNDPNRITLKKYDPIVRKHVGSLDELIVRQLVVVVGVKQHDQVVSISEDVRHVGGAQDP